MTTLPKPAYREKFHSILGHITTIRAGIWDIQQSPDVPDEAKDSLNIISEHAQQVGSEIEGLRETLYPAMKNSE